MHHEQDLFKMGGLRAKMPITFWTMLVATLAIIGFPGTSGFASKDEILYLAYLKNPALWVIGLIAACCTAFYMLRLFTLTFLGKARDHHAYDHAHESPVSMTLTLTLLAVGSLLAVWLGWPKAFGGDFHIEEWLAPAVTYGQLHAVHGEHGSHELAWVLASVSTLLGLSFAAWGYFSYKDGLAVSEARAAKFPFLHRLLLNKYYVDEGVELYLLRPIRWFGNLLWKLFDVILIDGVGVNLPGALARVFGDFTALFQTGRVRNYALSMALGAAVLLYVFLK